MKKTLIIVSMTLLLFVVTACNRNVSSSEYLVKKTKNHLQEIYSISYVATPVLKEYVANFHKETNTKNIKIHDKSNIAMVYGIDFDEKETLIFIPNYGTSKILSLTLNNPLDYKEVQQRIKTDYPDYDIGNLKAEIFTREVIENVDVIFGFPLTINNVTVIYYFLEGQLIKSTIE